MKIAKYVGAVIIATAVVAGCDSRSAQSKVPQNSATCFGFTNPANSFPANALTNATGAERKNLPPNKALSRWLKTYESKELGFDSKGWITLSRSDAVVKFGLPNKKTGLTAQADARKKNGKWQIKGSNCELTKVTLGRVVLPLSAPPLGTGDPSQSSVSVETHNDLDRCSNIRPTFTVKETTSQVRILATYPWDYKTQTVKGASDGPCDGSVQPREYTVQLEAPLAKRRVIQSGYVPGRPLKND